VKAFAISADAISPSVLAQRQTEDRPQRQRRRDR
jgi:hypothetical protein